MAFRTNDDGIALQSMTPLLKLGALVAAMPQARVRIAGYADPRGSDAYNEELSLRRAQSVAAVLSSAGVPAERIALEAHGKVRVQQHRGRPRCLRPRPARDGARRAAGRRAGGEP